MFNTLFAAAAAAATAAAGATATELAPGVHVIAGAFVAGAQPDGNTVVLRGPDGLVVIDTGRHEAHRQAIRAHAESVRLPVKAVVNTHWHLDHVGGNAALREWYPAVEVFATDAIRGAQAGFLAAYRKQLVERATAELGKAEGDPAVYVPAVREVALIDARERLHPNRPVTASGPRTLAGRPLQLHVERAVTAGDLWIFDPQTRTLVAGDLVTLPAPFLDTACPSRWQEALARVAAVDFARLVPGHGPVMDRAQLGRYRAAFDNLLACASSARAKAECADGWIADAGEWIPEGERNLARSLVDYYLDAHLRDAARTAKLCE
jgi:glyoxylase-like metal-dependent hydrolase (beta-lactamase superfamily II)